MRYLHKNTSCKTTSYYMYGKHAIFNALVNPKRNIKKIYCLTQFLSKYKTELTGVNIESVDIDFITKKVGRNQPHQGIIAYVDSVFLESIGHLSFAEHTDRVIILDQITDPQNAGAIIRSAAAFGINKIILPGYNSPLENSVMAKAASGCLDIVQIVRVANIKSAIDYLKKKGFWIAGLDLKGQENIADIINIEKLALIIGSENKGIRRLIIDSCDFLTKIPINKKVESLNAASAASIIFYSVTRNLPNY